LKNFLFGEMQAGWYRGVFPSPLSGGGFFDLLVNPMYRLILYLTKTCIMCHSERAMRVKNPYWPGWP